MQREEVKAQLAEMGVDEHALELRVASLTDTEVAEINGQIQDLPVGSDVLGIVLVITDVMGASDVFPFIKPVH